MDRIREEVVMFMEHNKYLTKLFGEDWFDMEDGLVELVEKISGLKDNTYNNNENVKDNNLSAVNTQIRAYKRVLEEYKDVKETIEHIYNFNNREIKDLCKMFGGYNLDEEKFDFTYTRGDIIYTIEKENGTNKLSNWVEFFDDDDMCYDMTIKDVEKELKELGE